jgi:glycosyltransferase involved in cell wall biosynthesis
VVLNGELWGLTSYFNPAGYSNRLEHARRFSAEVRRQGLKLLIVELAFGNEDFALGDGLADQHVRLKTNTVLWQKERLLNIGLDHLPDTCDKVAWLDADILFENDAWVRETGSLLNEYVVVQPYDVAWWLPPGGSAIPKGFSGRNFVAVKHGLAYTQAQAPMDREICGHLGFAWAVRRSVLQRHKFYDRLIVGSGDFPLCWAIYGDLLDFPGKLLVGDVYSEPQIEDISNWRDCFYDDVKGSAFFVEGRVFHLWHGRGRDRLHVPRLKLLKAANFDPRTDIALDSNGCWRWNTNKPDLHRQVREYFWIRKDDIRVKMDHQGSDHLG